MCINRVSRSPQKRGNSSADDDSSEPSFPLYCNAERLPAQRCVKLTPYCEISNPGGFRVRLCLFLPPPFFFFLLPRSYDMKECGPKSVLSLSALFLFSVLLAVCTVKCFLGLFKWQGNGATIGQQVQSCGAQNTRSIYRAAFP